MIIDENFKNILATGDEKQVNEVVSISLEKHKNYDVASKDPHQWCIWADINPRDALRLMNQWVEEGRDVSMFADHFKPDLTPCETFANALGYARHLKLKEFLFRNYGSYTYAMHTYSTTKVRNHGSANAPVGKSVTPNVDSKAYSEYASRFNDGPDSKQDAIQQQSSEVQAQQTEKPVTPRTVPQKDDRMALRIINRSDPRFNGVRLDKELVKLNETKDFIREIMLKEMKKV